LVEIIKDSKKSRLNKKIIKNLINFEEKDGRELLLMIENSEEDRFEESEMRLTGRSYGKSENLTEINEKNAVEI
jgi:hypothetical protein